MGFHDVEFPREIIGRGSRMVLSHRVEVTELASGHEQAIAFWENGRRTWDVSSGVQSLADVTTVQAFVRARGGAANSFKIWDPLDNNTNPANPSLNGQPGTRDQPTSPLAGDGTTTVFQLVKVYEPSGVPKHVPITLPTQGTVSIWVNGALQTEGTNYTLDYSTGRVTFATAPSIGHVVEWSGEFLIRARFSSDTSRAMSAGVDGWDLGQVPAIEIVEVLDAEPSVVGDINMLGGVERVFSASFVLSPSDGGTFVLSASTTGLYVQLPDPATFPPGLLYFWVLNDGAAAFEVRDENSVVLVTLAAGQGVWVALSPTATAAKIWYALGT